MKTFVKVKVAQLCLTLWDPMDYTENFEIYSISNITQYYLL